MDEYRELRLRLTARLAQLERHLHEIETDRWCAWLRGMERIL
jgi:hypothetical protein